MVLTMLQKLSLHVGLRNLPDDAVAQGVRDYLRTYPADRAALIDALDSAADAARDLSP